MTFSWSGPSARLSARFDRRGAVLELGIVDFGGRWRFERARFKDEDEGAETFATLLRMLRGEGR